MYNNDGVGAPQQEVKPNFDMRAANKAMREYDGNPNTLPVAQDVVDKFVKEYKNKPAGSKKFSLRSDSEGRELSKGQQEYFKDSKMGDENGNLKVMYHGTGKGGFTIFDPEYSDDGISLFFTDNLGTAKSYSGTYGTYSPKVPTLEQLNAAFQELEVDRELVKTNNGYELRWSEGPLETFDNFREAETYLRDEWGELYEFIDGEASVANSVNYPVYLNLTNPLVIEANGSGWDYLKPDGAIEVELTYQDGDWIMKKDGQEVELPDDFDPLDYADEIGDNELYEQLNYDTEYGDSYEFIDGARYFTLLDDTGEYAIEWDSTRTIAERALNDGYDGVIFKDLFDNGVYATSQEAFDSSTVAIAFNSDQVKLVDNDNPSHDPDIRYSLRHDSEGRELSKGQQEFYKDAKTRYEDGSLMVCHLHRLGQVK